MIKQVRKHKRNYCLIIRKNFTIKSRHWWSKYLDKLPVATKKWLPKDKYKQVNQFEFSVLITNNKEIRSLNKQYRNINKATDVLSFVQNNQKHKYLGDIIISQEYAQNSAKKINLSLECELLMLLIHGYLHLLGYDHMQKKDARIMFKLQNKILTALVFY